MAGEMVQGLREFLDAPEGFVSFYATEGTFAGRKVDGPSAAMHLADDTFWHFGLAIDLFEEDGQMPYHSIGFQLKLRHTGSAYELFIDDSPMFEIRQPEDFRPVYEHFFEFLKQRYRTSFDEFLRGAGHRRFGF